MGDKWQVGTPNAWAIHRQGEYAGTMATPELAQQVVDALNAAEDAGDEDRMVPFGAAIRVEYIQEHGSWWAQASLTFSAAADTLDELRTQTRAALGEIVGHGVPLTEFTRDA